MKIWYCEEDEQPIPEGEAVEVHTRSEDGDTGDATYCKTHAEKLGYSMDAIGEWNTLEGHGSAWEYRVEEL